jgi:hypothetical protein
MHGSSLTTFSQAGTIPRDISDDLAVDCRYPSLLIPLQRSVLSYWQYCHTARRSGLASHLYNFRPIPLVRPRREWQSLDSTLLQPLSLLLPLPYSLHPGPPDLLLGIVDLYVGVVEPRDTAFDEDQVEGGVDTDDGKVLDGRTGCSHVARHLLTGDDSAGVLNTQRRIVSIDGSVWDMSGQAEERGAYLMLTSTTRTSMRQRNTMCRFQTVEPVSFHRSRETLPDPISIKSGTSSDVVLSIVLTTY